MDKIQKKEFVKKTTETLNDIGLLVITHYSGLKTSETDELRLKLRETGGAFQITKNSLMQLVLKENKGFKLFSSETVSLNTFFTKIKNLDKIIPITNIIKL